MRVSVQGVSAQRGVYTFPRGQTDTCENINFPRLILRVVMKLLDETKIISENPIGAQNQKYVFSWTPTPHLPGTFSSFS